MLSIGVGETVTDGFKTYVLTSEFDSFLEAEDALGKYYGYDNITEIRY